MGVIDGGGHIHSHAPPSRCRATLTSNCLPWVTLQLPSPTNTVLRAHGFPRRSSTPPPPHCNATSQTPTLPTEETAKTPPPSALKPRSAECIHQPKLTVPCLPCRPIACAKRKPRLTPSGHSHHADPDLVRTARGGVWERGSEEGLSTISWPPFPRRPARTGLIDLRFLLLVPIDISPTPGNSQRL